MHWLGLLRRHPAFARMWLAEAISLAGDWFSLVAISVLAVREGGGQGALAVAATLAAHDLPMGLMRPLAGVLADRFDRRNLLVGVHLGQAALTALMVNRAVHADVAALQVLVLLRSMLGGLDWPARAGALRRVVPPEDLVAANAFSGATWSASYAIGMALGGLVSSFGVPLALAVDTGSFLIGAALLATLPAMPTRGSTGTVREAALQAATDLREAWALARSSPALLRAVLSKTPLGLAGGAAVVMLNVAADRTAFAGTAA
ncbi:MAG: MFS transporter, partial [Myxococcota bacterium]